MLLSQPLIVQAARSWVGTRFHHQGRVKKTDAHRGGVDCLGLLIGVARELDVRARDGRLLADLDETHYGLIPDGARLEAMLGSLLEPVALGDCASGDIALFRLDGNPQHLGIVSSSGLDEVAAQAANEVLDPRISGLPVCMRSSDPSLRKADDVGQLRLGPRMTPHGDLHIIHAYAPVRAVVEHALDEAWKKKMIAAFRIPEI